MSVQYPSNHPLDTPSPAFSHATAGYVSDYSSDYYHMDQVEHECLEHYESNLEKYKDERDAIQKKTFTKWVNKHLTKTGRKVEDLFLDLRDGFNLIALLEALSAETLPKENGYTRFHRIQNVQYCLDFLRKKHIKLVNIRPEDIVEGNGKLTLGLIWTIILNFQVSVIKHRQRELELAAMAASEGYANGHTTHAASSASAASSIYSTSASVVLNNRQNGCKTIDFRFQRRKRCPWWPRVYHHYALLSPAIITVFFPGLLSFASTGFGVDRAPKKEPSSQHDPCQSRSPSGQICGLVWAERSSCRLKKVSCARLRYQDGRDSKGYNDFACKRRPCIAKKNQGWRWRSKSLRGDDDAYLIGIPPLRNGNQANAKKEDNARKEGDEKSGGEGAQRGKPRIWNTVVQAECKSRRRRNLAHYRHLCAPSRSTLLHRRRFAPIPNSRRRRPCVSPSPSVPTARFQDEKKKERRNRKSSNTARYLRERRAVRSPPAATSGREEGEEPQLPLSSPPSSGSLFRQPPPSARPPTLYRLFAVVPALLATFFYCFARRLNSGRRRTKGPTPSLLLPLLLLLLFRAPSSATGFLLAGPYAVSAQESDDPTLPNDNQANYQPNPSSLQAAADPGAPLNYYCTDYCPWLFSRSHALAQLALATLLFLLLLTTIVMHKVFKSYSRKAERKYEHSGGAAAGGDYQRVHHENGGGPYVTSPPSSVRNGGLHAQQQQQHYDSYQRSAGRDYSARSAEYAGTDSTYQRGGAGREIIPTREGDGYQAVAQYHTGGAAHGGFSESSSYETKEHYERKMVRKKTRGERERARKANGVHASNGSLAGKYKVSEVLRAGDGLSARDALLQWAKKVTAGYPGVNVTNFTNSWRDGLAFNAILHRYRPNAVDWQRVSDRNVSNRERLRNAFDTADHEFGVAKLLDPEDVDRENPDEKSIITYVSSLYNALPNLDALSKCQDAALDYERDAIEWLAWVDHSIRLMNDRQMPMTLEELERLVHELQKFKDEDMPPRFDQKQHLIETYHTLKRALYGTDFWRIPDHLSDLALERAWDDLLRAIYARYEVLAGRAELQVNGDLNDLKSRLARGIGITNEKLDLILKRIEDLEARLDTASPAEIERGIQAIIDDLNALEAPIQEFFEDVETLKQHNDPDADDFYKQVYGLHQRQTAYLDRVGAFGGKLGARADFLRREESERYASIRTNAFRRVEEAIEWVRERMDKLNNMVFNEDLETLEAMFDQHKLDNRDIQDFQQTVKECIARQAEVSAEDSYEYCELLRTLESEYQQLRDLSAGRVLDLDSLIAFIRAAQLELVWIHEREEIEVTRNWSDINQLDLPMLQNYYKQLLHEIELREKQFNDVYNQGAALINQRHPAVDVIEVYLRTMQSQWDWLLGLSRCLEGHLRDALNLKAFTEDATAVQEWLGKQLDYLESNYNRSDFSLEEGERYLRELDEIKEIINKNQSILMSLTERSQHISPLWQRGERIDRPIPVTAWCDYNGKDISIRTGDDCTLVDNSDLIHWKVIGVDGVEATVPSVVFRIPPPDPRIASLLKRLLADFEKLRKLWEKKHRMVRFNMVLNTMKHIQGWDLDTFLSLSPEQRDEIIKALNDDANKLLSEMDPNDPLYLRLQEELKRTNDHFLDLLRQAQKGPEVANQFDEKLAELLKKLEEAWKKLNDRVGEPVPKTPEELERIIYDHKAFEEALQALDPEVSNVKELFRQLQNPTPTQRANMDHLNGRWEDLWDLSRMYVERLKALEKVLQGLIEVEDIVRKHEVTLSSFDDLPSALDKLRGVHSQLLELNMVLQQQEHLVHELNKNVAQLRQHVARTRFNVASHPDVDRLEDQVQQVTVRWDNVVSQVTERLKTAEDAQQTQMIYRSQYDEEILWLDRVEATINSLRRPEDLPPEKLQEQLDVLMAEYAQLQEHTATIENINKEGGKFIRDAKTYDARIGQFRDNVVNIHGHQIKNEFRRQTPQPKNGAQIVTEELEALNRRFAQLSSVILERKNTVQVLIKNWERKQKEDEERRRAEEEAKRRAFEAARLKALEDADRLRREREAAEAARRAAEEADRLRRERDAAEAARRAAEEAERRRREEEERRRREAEDAERRRREEEERRRREEEERRRREAERLKPKMPEIHHAPTQGQGFGEEGFEEFEPLQELPDKAHEGIHPEEDMETFAEETVTKTQFYEMEGVLHKQTGEILTFVEAIRQGLLDLSSGGGEFFDILSGSRLSLEKAAEMKLIGEDVNEVLQAKHGLLHPESGEPISLLEAIQIGLYDPEIRQLRDIHTGEILSLFDARKICPMDVQRKLIKMGVLKLPPITLEQAIQQNCLNTETGHFTGKFSGDMPLKDALYNGYIQLRSQQAPTIAISLSDCLAEGLIDGHSGEFVDRNTNDKFTLRDALSRDNKLINEFIREIVNTDTNQRITLADAIVCHAINHRQGNFTDLRNRSSISLRQAFDNDYISKPLTLTEVVERDLLDSTHRFIDRGTKHRFTLLEAIAAGVIDPEVRHIVDPDEEDVVSIAEALERGLLEADGRVSLLKQQRTLSLHEAHHDGLLTKRVRHTIFDVKGIKNTQTGENLSFNEAVEAGAIITQAERIVDLRSKDSYLISDASNRGIIDPMLQELLATPVGIRHEGQELSLIRAVSKGIIDPKKGVFFDKRSNRELTPREAYDSGLITLRGALKLYGLFDVNPSLMTPIKKRERRRRIARPGQQQLVGDDQIKVTLAEAMKQGLIDARSQRFRQGGQEMSLHDALSQGLIDPSSEWIIPSRSSAVGPTIEEKTQETVTETAQQLAPKIYPDQQIEETVSTVKRVRRTETSAVGGPGGVSVYRAITGSKGAIEVPAEGYHVREAERRGMVDLSTGVVAPPGTDRTLNLEEAFTLGVLNPNSITIKDPKSGRSLNALEAIEQKIIDKNGNVDYRGRRLTLQEAVEERIAHLEAEPPALVGHANKKIIQFSSGQGPVMSFRPVGQAIVEEHDQAWSFDAQSGQFVDHQTGQTLSIDRALESGKLSADDLRVRDALTGREMSFDEAQKWGIINLRDGYYLDKTNNQRLNFTEAARQQRVYPTGGVPENAADAVHTTLKIHTRSEISKKEAIPAGSPAYVEYNITKLVNQRAYNPDSGLFQPPDAQKQMTLKELIVKGYLNPYNTTIVDRRNRKDLRLLDAIDENIVDDVAGTVKDTQSGRTYNFAEAVREGLIKETTDSSFDVTYGSQQRLGIEEGRASRTSQPSSSYSPRLAERKLQLTPFSQEPQPKSTSSSRQGFVSTYESSSSQDFRQPTASTTFSQPSQFGQQQQPSGGSFVKNQVALMERGGGQQQLSKDERYVDLGGGNQVKVKVVRGQDGVEKGEYFDPSTGMKFTIQLHGDPFVTQTTTKVRSTSQVQSIDLEPHAQLVGMNQVKDLRTGRVMSLDEAQRMGIARVDRKGKQATKSYSVFRSNIQLAVNKGVIDSSGEKISLEDAIRSRVVDIVNLKYIHPKTNEPLDLAKAANMGLIDVTLAETLPKGVTHPANGENIPVRRAIDLGIIDARSGTVKNPFTNEKLTWIDLLKPMYASITMQGVYDPKKGYGVPIANAFNEGLIETRSGTYYNAITEERIPLEEAASRGLIDQGTYDALSKPFLQDYRTRRQLNLVQAVDLRLVDPRNRTVQLSADRTIPIAKAVEEGAFPREIGERLRRHDKLNFAEALGKGLIDVAQDTFTDPDTGKSMSIAQAVSEGFVDTGNVESADSTETNNLARIIASDEFDERSGRIQDRKTGMYLTFRDAIERNIIDPDSLLHDLESSKTMTVREALNKGLIDNDGKYVDSKTRSKITLNEAAKSGLVALIASPMQAAQAVSEAVKRREAEGYKFKIESLETAERQRQSQPKFREETTTTFRLTPQRAEPGLSVRVRSSMSGLSDDNRSSRARSLIDDPLAQRELQDEFLDNLQNKNFNVDEKVLENPNTNLNVSIREAVETGLLDVLTGEVVHPRSLRRYSIPKAVHMRMLNPDAARRLMEALNMSLEELQSFSPASTTRVEYSTTSQYSDAGPHVQFSPASNISSDNGFNAYRRPSGDQTSSTSTKERVISWKGDTAELRTDPNAPRTKMSTQTYTSPDGQTQYTTKYTTSSSSYQYP